jgi:hypothetical protein
MHLDYPYFPFWLILMQAQALSFQNRDSFCTVFLFWLNGSLSLLSHLVMQRLATMVLEKSYKLGPLHHLLKMKDSKTLTTRQS